MWKWLWLIYRIISLYFLVGTEENHNVPVRGANPWTELDQRLLGQTKSMEENSWETYSFSASQKISCISQNPKIHYYVQKSPPLVQILSQINPVHALNPTALNINTIIPYTPWSSKWSPDVSCPQQIPVCSTRTPICATACTTHLNVLRFSL